MIPIFPPLTPKPLTDEELYALGDTRALRLWRRLEKVRGRAQRHARGAPKQLGTVLVTLRSMSKHWLHLTVSRLP